MKGAKKYGAIEQVKMGEGDLVLVFGDLHYDIADQRLVDALLELALKFKISRFVFQGDSMDGFGASRHKRDQRRKLEDGVLLHEGAAFRKKCLDPVRTIASYGGWVRKVPGNHDGRRIEDLISDTPGLRGQSYVDLFGLRPCEHAGDGLAAVHFLDYGQILRLGSLNIEHGDQLPGAKAGGAGAAVKVLSKAPDRNVLFGHTHRVEVACRDNHDGVQYGAYNVGHLSNLDFQTYRGRHEGGWQHGAAVIDFYRRKGKGPVLFDVTPLRFVNRCVRFRGETFYG